MSGRSALEHYKNGGAWWETAISDIKKNSIIHRGKRIEDLIGNVSYSQMLFFLLVGKELSEQQAKLFESVLVAGADHGPRAPSIAAARMAATCGVSFNSAVATGINMLGDIHGGAVEYIPRKLNWLPIKMLWRIPCSSSLVKGRSFLVLVISCMIGIRELTDYTIWRKE